MTTKMRVKNPDTIEVSMELTMTLKQWKELRAQLPSVWPSFDFSGKITDMVIQIEKTYYPQTET